jgi:lysophospholipase L1-like esterase
VRQTIGLALAIGILAVLITSTAWADTVTVMPLGDSITNGVGSSDDNGFRRALYLSMTGGGYTTEFVGTLTTGDSTDFDRDHEGHSGWHANQIRDNIYNWLGTNPADIVLLHIGTNDIGGGQSAPGIKTEIDAILDNIDQFEADSSMAITVFLAQIINRSDTTSSRGLETKELNDSLAVLADRRVAAGDDIVLVDLEHCLTYPGDLPDGVHPDDAGYVKMADTWFSALDDFLGVLRVDNLSLTSTSGNGYDADDLTAEYDLGGGATTAATAWYKDSSPVMVAYLPMEGGATDALLDYSGSSNDGTASGDPSWQATGGFDANGCFQLDGNDHVDLGNVFPSGAYTKAAWVKWQSGQNYNNIISGQSAHAFWVYDTGGYRLASGHNGTWNQVSDPDLFATEVWTFVAVTFDPAVGSGTLRLYKNGAVVDTATGIPNINSDNRAYIGSYNGSAWFKGWIDDARIYDYALTPAQIQAMYASGAGDHNIMVAEETSVGDQWQVQVTPFDTTEAGSTAVSNAVTIVADPPASPVITSTPVTSATVGRAYSYNVDATGTPAPIYSLSISPTGMVVDSLSGVIDWTPQTGQEGSNSVEVVATNTSGADTQNFNIDVAARPPCPENITHYWKFDETTGAPYEDFWGENDATCSSCPTATTGRVNGGQLFDGSDDEVNVADDGTFDWGADDSFTIQYWMMTSASTAGNRVLVGRDDSGTNLHWWVGCDDNGTVRFNLNDTNGNGKYIGNKGDALNDGEWHLITAVRDNAADMNRIFVDDAAIDSAAHNYTAGFGSSVPMNIGFINLSGHYRFEGTIDEVALYDRALTLSEISAQYTKGMAGYGYCDTIPASDPEIENLSLVSSSGNNYNSDSLIVSYDLAGSATTAAAAWYKDGSPIMSVYFPMEGGEPAALSDYSGNGNTASKNGDPSWGSAIGHDGKGAYDFDGNDDLDGGENFPTSSSYTKTAWVYRTGSGANGGNNIIAGDENTGGHAFWAPDSYGRKLSAGHNGTWNSVQDDVELALNTWYFVAVTWDDATDEMILYKNGSPVDTATVTPDVTDATISIGSFGYSNGFMWQGRIDDARVFSRALSPEQIQEMYGGGSKAVQEVIVPEETVIGDEWHAAVTPFSDSEAGSAYVSDTLLIQGAGTAPVITTTPDTEGAVGEFYTYDVDATGTPAPVFSMNISPAGMVMDTTSGIIDWVPSAGQEGLNEVEVVATNTAGSDTQNFDIDVAAAPACPAEMSHYWKLDETGGPPYIDYYGDNDATCTNCPDTATGIVGNAQSFNGTDDEVQLPDDDTFDWGMDDSFTMQFWMNTSASQSGNRVILGRDDGPTSLHWWIGFDSNRKVRFQLQDTNGNGQYIGGSGPSLNDGEWHLITAVRDDAAGMNRVYVDATVIDSASHNYTAGFAESVPANLGYIQLSDNYRYQGLVDEVAFYDKALTRAEIESHYYRGLAGNGYCDVTEEAPVITSTPDTTGMVGVEYTYDINATGYPVPTYGLNTFPTGMVVDSLSGVITWTPQAGQEGSNAVEAVATNSAGADTQAFNINVAPDLDPEIENLVLASTSGNNYTVDSLICTYDLAGSATTAATAWYIDDSPMMVGYYPMEGGASTADDDFSGNDNDGVIGGDPTWNATGGFDGNGCFDFDGDADNIDLGNIFPAGAYTKTAWFKWTSGNPHNNIISGDASHAFWVYNDSGMRLTSGHNGNWTMVSDPEAFVEGVWSFVAVTYDPADDSTLVLYKNGSPVDSASDIPLIDSDTRAYIGSFTDACCYVLGSIDDARIYDYALSADQIEAMYAAGAGDANRIVPAETDVGEDWYASVTPFSDTETGSAYVSDTLTIIDYQIGPEITSSPVTTGTVGELYTYDVDATGFPSPVFGLQISPAGMVVDTLSGVITWAPVGGQEGLNAVEVVATNAAGTDTQRFNIDVAEAPACSEDMTHYYKFEETGGPPYADFYGENDATCTNCPTVTTGIVDSAQFFDGSDDEVQLPDDGSFDWAADASFTVQYWMMTDASTSGNRVIVGRDGGPTSLHWWIGCDDNGKVRFNLNDINGNGQYIGNKGDVLNDGEWHLITAVRDDAAGMNRIYVDAALIDSAAHDYTAGFAESVPVNVGYINLSHNYRYEGRVDELAFWDKALAPAEIRSHYNRGLAGNGYCETADEAPVITSTPVTEGRVYKPYSYDVDATGYPLPKYSLNVFPTGMVVDSTSGAITWTPQPGQEGMNAVEVVASNRAGADTQNFSIDVGEAPDCPSDISHYWRLNEAAGPTYADYWGDTDATCVNCPTSMASMIDTAQWFDGDDDEVDVADDGTFDWGADDSFTVQYWMMTDKSTSGNRVIVGRDDASTSLHWWIGCNDAGVALFQLRDASGYGGAVSGGGAINDSVWHMVTAVRDGNADKNYIFVDGAVVDSASYDYGSSFAGTVPMNIGYINLSGHYRFEGAVDEVGTFDRALSRAEIADHYSRGLAGYGYCGTITVAPEITSTPVTDGIVGVAYSYDVDATGVPDPTYALNVYPAGMVVDSLSGVIDWIPQAGQEGLNAVEVVATNVAGADTQNFDIDVSAAPTIENLALTSTSGDDLDDDDLTCSYDLAGSAITAATAWYKDGATLMVLYLPMEGDEPDALNDYSGNDVAVGKNGDPTWSGSAGYDGFGAYVFDGNDDLSAGDNFPVSSSYTKTAWVYRTGGSGCNIISGDENTGGHAFWAPDSYGHKLSAGHNGTWNSVQDSIALAVDTWFFVAVTWDSSTGMMSLYRNAVLVDTATVSELVSDATISIGSFGFGNGFFWQGTLDDIRIYGHVLSPEQIEMMYSGGLGEMNVIDSEETELYELWQAEVTPFASICAGESYLTDTLRIKEATAVGDNQIELVPTATRLVGAKPNPFNPTTSVFYDVHQPDHVTIRIFDVNGRLVRTLVDETKNAGSHTAMFDGRDNQNRDVGAGVYFIRMHTSSSESTMKVVLIK